VVHRGGLAAYSCGGSRGFAQARTAFPWPTTGDYRDWAHERNAAGAVTAHDAIAPHSKNNSAKAESIEFLRNLVGDAPSVRVQRMRARRAPPASQAASGNQPVQAAARDARLALKLKVAREGFGKEEVASSATISMTDRDRLGARPHPRIGDIAVPGCSRWPLREIITARCDPDHR
jgi:hypothetical protein